MNKDQKGKPKEENVKILCDLKHVKLEIFDLKHWIKKKKRLLKFVKWVNACEFHKYVSVVRILHTVAKEADKNWNRRKYTYFHKFRYKNTKNILRLIVPREWYDRRKYYTQN